MDAIIKESEQKMIAVLSRLSEELKKIRTGGASTGLVEDLKVSYYGTMTPIKELASISVPEPSLIQIKPFDRNAIGDIEMAIRNADLGFSPVNDGTFVRISLPPLTEERRREMANQVKKIGDEIKVLLRTARGESWDSVQKKVKNKELTEDDKYQAEKLLNEMVDKKNKEVDRVVSEKEKDLMKL